MVPGQGVMMLHSSNLICFFGEQMMGIIIEKGTKKNGCHTCHLLAEKPRKRRGEKKLGKNSAIACA